VDPATGKYSQSRYISSFVGFARGVEPRLVIFAALDGPKGVYYASETAAPLFQKVLQAVVNRFSIPATEKIQSASHLMAEQAPAAAPASQASQDNKDLIPIAQAHPEAVDPWRMPSVMGLSAREALRVLAGRPFDVDLQGEGVVRAQVPSPGETVAGRTQIRLSLGSP
jgi:cell division protein FtsI (penicillin-binding protein 3)